MYANRTAVILGVEKGDKATPTKIDSAGAVRTRTAYTQGNIQETTNEQTHHKTRKDFNDYEGLAIAFYVKTIIGTVENEGGSLGNRTLATSTEY